MVGRYRYNKNIIDKGWFQVPFSSQDNDVQHMVAHQKQRSQKIPPALCRCSKCPPALPYEFRHAGTSGTVAEAAGRAWGSDRFGCEQKQRVPFGIVRT